MEKAEVLPREIKWHFIGGLQESRLGDRAVARSRGVGDCGWLLVEQQVLLQRISCRVLLHI
jgi:hypothetical protein